MFYMRSVFCATFALLLGSNFAYAGDTNWTGIYIGGNAGVAWGDTKIDGDVNDAAFGPQYTNFFETNVDSKVNSSGFAGGVKAGGNYQLGLFVAGLEVSYDWLDVDGNRATGFISPGGQNPDPFNFTDAVKIDDLFTVRGRLGVTVEHALVYVTGGYASADVKRSQALISVSGNNFLTGGSDRMNGWTLGGGFEYNLFGGWALTAEYLHVELDDEDHLTAVNLPGKNFNQRVTTKSETDFDIARGGLTYRF